MFKAYQDFEKRTQQLICNQQALIVYYYVRQFFKSVLIDAVTITLVAALYFHVDQSLYFKVTIISQIALSKIDTLL